VLRNFSFASFLERTHKAIVDLDGSVIDPIIEDAGTQHPSSNETVSSGFPVWFCRLKKERRAGGI
jgi:hypothetical protein